MNFYRILFVLTIIFWPKDNCFGSNYSFTKLSIENGLSNNHVNVIFKDSYGFIWFGTLEGLDRFDGLEVRPYSAKFQGKVENVHAITEDFNKQLWVGTSTGLFRFDNKNDKFDKIQEEHLNLLVQALAILPDSNILVGTTNGLFKLDSKTYQTEKLVINNTPGNQSNSISSILPDSDGTYWISTSGGLVRYSFNDKKNDLYECQLNPKQEYNSFSSICSLGNKLYLGTRSVGIVEFDINKKEFSKGIKTGNNIILSMSSDNKERIFTGTDGGGLKIINVNTLEVKDVTAKENDPGSISSNSVYSIYLDGNERIWLGTFSAGVCYSNNYSGTFKINNINKKNPEFNKSIRSFYFSPDGSQYFGTRNGFIYMNNKGETQQFQTSANDTQGLKSNIILTIYPFNNDILIGTYGGGISSFSVAKQKIVPFLDDNIFQQQNVYGFDTDMNGHLWISTFNGIYKYSKADRSLVNFNSQNSVLNNDQIFDIMFDTKGRLWVGTMSGTFVYNYDGNKLSEIKIPEGTDNTYKVNYIYEDKSGNIWICTERGGMQMIDRALTKCRTYLNSDGLPDNSVCAIIEGNKGEYWISTLKGFCKYSLQSQKFTRFSKSSGLPGLVFTPGASYKSADNNIFFGNEKGLIYFNPDNIVEKPTLDDIRITDFFIAGKVVKPGNESVLKQTIEETKEIHLKSNQNNFGFRFVSINYGSPVDDEYEYILQGHDSNWRNNGSNNTVSYEKLKPGKYKFKVRNIIESDNDENNIAELDIIIHRSLFGSVYFILFLILIISVGVFFVVRYIKILQNKARKIFDMPEKHEKYKGSRISKTQSDAIIQDLIRHMEQNKPYLNSELKLADLAHEINYHVNELSQVLNQDLNQSFSDFVNKYRVEEVKRRMEDKEYEKYTFVAISQQCGFNSKTSFYRIFRNETGKTPADYAKALNLKDRDS